MALLGWSELKYPKKIDGAKLKPALVCINNGNLHYRHRTFLHIKCYVTYTTEYID
jgi:hypothetical protein